MKSDYYYEWQHNREEITCDYSHRTEEMEFFINYWLDSVNKEYHEIQKRYFEIAEDRGEIYAKMRELFKDKLVIPFADFSVNMVCTLKCQDCSIGLPFVEEKYINNSSELIGQINTIFKYIDYIHIISPFGGEPFLNKDLDVFLLYLKKMQEEGKIGYIRLVTNGTLIPSEKVINSLRGDKVFVLISNYETIFDEKALTKRNALESIFADNKINYYLMPPEFEWISMGDVSTIKSNETEVLETYMTCSFKNCFGIYNGKLYRCGRQYACESVNEISTNSISFDKISSKEEMRQILKDLYSSPILEACQYCNPVRLRTKVEPAIQIVE